MSSNDYTVGTNNQERWKKSCAHDRHEEPSRILDDDFAMSEMIKDMIQRIEWGETKKGEC